MTDCPLTGCQLQAMDGLAAGQTMKQIAVARDVTGSTIRSHLSDAYHRLGVPGQTQAVLACQAEGWVQAPRGPPVKSADIYLIRLANATEELCAQIRGRHKLTAAQTRYLAAFDDLLYAHTDTQAIRARERMDRALGTVLHAAAVTPKHGQQRDLVSLLVAYVRRSQRVAPAG